MKEKNKKEISKDRVSVVFSALDKSWEDNIIKPTEIKNGEMMVWGDGNQYPRYLHDLYESVATLQSVIDGTVDYICGSEVKADKPNPKSDMETLVRCLALDLLKYGGFSFNVIKNAFGKVTDVYYLDFKSLRSDENNTSFWYSKKWEKYHTKALRYPAYTPDGDDKSSVYYFKLNSPNTTYPRPLWAASVTACEIEKEIDKFHLNNIHNGFVPSYIINFLNGIPSDEVREEIECDIMEKFTGSDNAGRFILNFASDKDHATSVEKIEVSDFDKQYESLSKRSRQQIFTAFRANPNLFGISTENIGFSKEEYKDSFELYNNTTVSPLRRHILTAIQTVLGIDVTITPFEISD